MSAEGQKAQGGAAQRERSVPSAGAAPDANTKLEFWGVRPLNSLRLLNMSAAEEGRQGKAGISGHIGMGAASRRR